MNRRTGALVLALACVAGAARAQSVVFGVGGQLSAPISETMMVPIYVDMTGAPGVSLGSFTMRISWIQDSLYFMDCDCQLPVERAAFGGTLAVNSDSAYYGVLKVAGASSQGVDGVAELFRIPMQFYYYYYQYGTTPIDIEVTEASAAGTFADLLPSVTTVSGVACPAVGRWGDLDEDGRADSRDALAVLSSVVGLAAPGFDLTLGDVDGDGLANSRDALILLSYAVGIDIAGQRVLLVAPGACVVPEIPRVAIVPDTVDLIVDQRVRPVIVPTDAAGTPTGLSVLSWTVDDPEVAAIVDETGLLVGRGAGTTVLRAALGPGVVVTAPVVVRAQRGTWYVDREKGLGQPVQLGTFKYPLATPNLAFPAAVEGDTIRFSPGVHEWDPEAAEDYYYDYYYYYYMDEVHDGIVFFGDTLADGTRPTVRGPQYNRDLTWYEGVSGRIENLVLQNTYFYIEGLRNLHVKNVSFEFTDPENAIYVYGYSIDTLSIENADFVSPTTTGSGYGVSVWEGAKFVRLHDSRFTRYYTSVYLYQVDSLDVQRNEFHYTDVAMGSWSYSQARPFSTAIVIDNVVDSAGLGLWASADSVVMTDNVLTQITEDGIAVEEAYGRAGTGMVVARNEVTCDAPFSSSYGIQVYGVPGHVDDNTVAGCRSYGLYANEDYSYPLATLQARRNQVTMLESGTGYGMYLYGRLGLVSLYGNTVRNGQYGVYYSPYLNTAAGDTTRFVADSNAISGTGHMGLYLYVSTSYSGSVLGVRNNISNNLQYGVYSQYNGPQSFAQGRFEGNQLYAVYSSYAFDASQNWWGDQLGPGGTYGAPGSNGDAVTSAVNWDPHLTTAPTDVPPLAAQGVSAAALAPTAAFAVDNGTADRRSAIWERVRRARQEQLAGRGRQD